MFIEVNYGRKLAEEVRNRSCGAPMMLSPDALAALKPVADCFRLLNIPFYVGGSVASSAYGKGRSTMDVDVVAELDLAKGLQLAAMLGGDYYVSDIAIREAVGAARCLTSCICQPRTRLTFLSASSVPTIGKRFARIQTKTLTFDGEPFLVPVAGPEDVILAKLQWYELGNRVSENQWNDILGVLRGAEFETRR